MRQLHPISQPRRSCVILATGALSLLRGELPATGETDRGIPFGVSPPDPGGRFLCADRWRKQSAVSSGFYRAPFDTVPVIQASAVWGA